MILTKETREAIKDKFTSNEEEAAKLVETFIIENEDIQSYQSHMAAIALCEENNIEELKHYLSCAVVDPRDVLYWYHLSQTEKK